MARYDQALARRIALEDESLKLKGLIRPKMTNKNVC